MSIRKLSEREEKLITLLVELACLKLLPDWKNTIRVEPMNDGGMGSLKLFPTGIKKGNPRFGSNVSNLEFLDRDGMSILAGLFLSESGELFELDMFKGDGSSLVEIPDVSKMKEIKVGITSKKWTQKL